VSGNAIAWLGGTDGLVATCPITQGALIRMLIRRGVRPDQALHQLGVIAAHSDVAHLVPTG